MKLKILSSSILLIICLGILFTTPQKSHASTKFLDGKLKVNGFIKETANIRTAMNDRDKDYNQSRVDFLQTSGLFEMLYTAKDEEDLGINLFVGFKYWWQKAQWFDDEMRKSVPHHQRKDWYQPRSFDDDMLTEAYVDITTGPWKFRVGKQIVIWGQLDLERVADVVNPLDLRRGPPGVNTWEEVKQGLWMIRVFYQSDLPGNLLFETIFNPGDFQNFETPYEGTGNGVPAWASRFGDSGEEMGMYSWQREKWTRDAPGWNLKDNYEFGFRIRGNTFDIDWTLLYWNARDDGPVADPDTIFDYSMLYVDGDISDFDANQEKVYYFKRYETVGGTAQYYSHKLWDTVWRLEWFYEIGRPLNKASEGQIGRSGAIDGWTERDILGVAIQCNKKWNIPWFTKNVVNNLMLESNITYGWEKVFNHDKDLVLASRNHYWENSTNDVVTMFLMQGLRDMSFVFVFTGNYHLRTGKYMAIPSLSYIFPGIHWRADIGYVAFGAARDNKEWVRSDSSLATGDYLFLRLRYEF
jgi:hypothetical protein